MWFVFNASVSTRDMSLVQFSGSDHNTQSTPNRYTLPRDSREAVCGEAEVAKYISLPLPDKL
jgi:hypothetical protein